MSNSYMYQEAREASSRIREQCNNNATIVAEISERIKLAKPQFVVMIGRGSSDHASLFAKYLIEIETGMPVMHAAPSIASIYKKSLHLDGALVIAISQSGQSPDIVEYMTMARAHGAITIALVNKVSSPLSLCAEYILPMAVGEERAVAATKSFLGSLSALVHLVASYKNDKALIQGLEQLPEQLQRASEQKPLIHLADLADIEHCIVLARGMSYAIGMELALKLKEICAIQAECFSSAEFLHGPVRIVSKELSILNIQVQDESYDTHLQQTHSLLKRGASITSLTCPQTDVHPRLIPLLIMQRCYLDLEYISRALGYNPDLPEGLAKVTETT